MDFQDEASCPVKICQVRQTQDAAIDPAQTVRHVVQPMCFIGCGFCFFKRLPRAVRVVMHSINTHFDKPNANQPGQLQAVYTCLYSLYMSIHVYTIIEGSLEVKLPTIWTDEKQSRAEAEQREEKD